MFIKVKLLNGFSESLLYTVPDDWDKTNLLGAIVKVPLRNTINFAFIEEVIPGLENKPIFTIKPAIAIEEFPIDKTYSKFISELANYYQANPSSFVKRIKQFITQTKKDLSLAQSMAEIAIQVPERIAAEKVELTDEQQRVFDFLNCKVLNPEYAPTLLHGVTGSGKTEVYKKLIIQNFAQNKSTLLLLPEVTLALQFEQLLRNSLPSNIKIFNFHSASTPAIKREMWQNLILNKPMLIIGVHLPVLLPIPNLGLIIIDEEHEIGYQEKKHPKINTKEAAILKASLNKIPILFGSATPSLTSLYNVKSKGWHFFQLKNRFKGKFPEIELVNLLDRKQRKNFWISTKLQNAIKQRLENQEQTIIFLNRRGYSFFVQCEDCEFIFKCNNCSVSLILHSDNWLYCHYCALKMQYPKTCTQCKQSDDKFIKKGIGTEQVVDILQDMFPNAVIERADSATVTKKKKWNDTVKKFSDGKIDILVGTQTITKGYHFPKVTLVGILWADLNLHFPIYNACEIVLQQLIQVAGRAGRQSDKSNVIVQTMIDHPIFDYLNEIDYLKFYKSEIENRKESNYPPHTKLVEIEFKHTNENIVERESHRFLQELCVNADLDEIKILGPVKPIIYKIKNTHMRKIYLKSNNINAIINLFKHIEIEKYKSKIFFTPNPIT